jgi:hypothetical protein
MHRACQEIDGLQLIVLDHARLADDWFKASIVEEWRRNSFLVPPAWDVRAQSTRLHHSITYKHKAWQAVHSVL